MKLFSFWRSLATYRVRIALNLKGIKPDVVTVDLLKGHQRAPEFKAVNPQMVTPHTEAFQALIWHLLVSDPRLQTTSNKWESSSK